MACAVVNPNIDASDVWLLCSALKSGPVSVLLPFLEGP